MKAQFAIALVAVRILCAAPNQWTSVGPEGGIIVGLAADSQNPPTILASTFGGGLFKTSDGGGSWVALTGLPDRCCILAVDPSNTGTAYAVAGDGFYKTIDGGASWNLVSLRAIGFTVQTLRVTSSGALYASGGGGPIAKSTDGGARWNRLSSELTLLAIDPRNPDTLYANGPPRGVLKSVDGGANWSVVNSSGYFSFLVVDPQNSDTLYGGAGWQLLKSTDGGASWVLLSFGLKPTKPPVIPDGILSLAVHPKNSALLYGIVNRFIDVPGLLSSTYYLIASTDGGETWTTATDPMLTVGDLKTILPDPTDPGTWYLGTTNGVLKTADGGASWSFENSGFQATPIRRVVVDPQAGGTLFALPDTMGQTWRGIGLFKSTDGGSSWFPSGFGLPWGVNSIVADPLNAGTLYAAGPHNNGASSFQGFGVFKSGDGGASWNEVWAIPTPGTGIYPLAISAQAPNVLYAGVTACPHFCITNVARSSDAGRTWTQALTPLSTDEYLSAIAVDPRDPNVVYAGTSDLGGWGTGGLFKSVDGGASWTRTGNGAVYTLLIDPGNPDKLNSFIAGPCDPLFDAFAYDPRGGTLYCGGDAKVLRSTNAGKNWTEVGSGLRGHVNALAFGSQDPRKLYAATSGGLFEINLDSLDDNSDQLSVAGHDSAAAGQSKKDRPFRRRL